MKKVLLAATLLGAIFIFISAFNSPESSQELNSKKSAKTIPLNKLGGGLSELTFNDGFYHLVETEVYITEDLLVSEPITIIEETSAYHTTPYDKMISKVLATRDSLRNVLESNPSNKDAVYEFSRSYLHNTLTVDVFPYWYGTPWDFNGISNVPGKGEIACGYFISTTMKHIGFNMNRYRVAQKAASDIIYTLSGKENSPTFTNLNNLQSHLLLQPDGVYIVGLSSHVGFIEKRGNQTYFIHSNYFAPAEVIKEKLLESPAIRSSGVYVLGSLNLSDAVIKTWLYKSEIKV